jgi:O-antigen/teichoic acid export membrane protein
MRLVLKFSALLMLLGGVGLQVMAPLVFAFFKGKFTGGLAVIDWTTIYLIWYGLMTIALAYLWCAERTWWGSIALAAGLVANVALCYALLPRIGLPGAVYATAAGNAVTLLLVYSFMGRLGLRFDAGVWLLSAAPLVLGFGPWVGVAGALAIFAVVFGTPWLLDDHERTVVRDTIAKYRDRFIRGARAA